MKGAAQFLGMAEHLTDKSASEIWAGHGDIMQAEESIKHYLAWSKIKVARFRRVMFLVRDPEDKYSKHASWAKGVFHPNSGYFIKYIEEYQQALKTQQYLEEHNNSWDNFRPDYLPIMLDQLRSPVPTLSRPPSETVVSLIASGAFLKRLSDWSTRTFSVEDPGVSPATSGKPFQMAKRRVYDGPTPDFHIKAMPSKRDGFCISKCWAVVTTIFEVTTSVRKLDAARDCCTVVVADKKSLAKDQYFANSTRIKYLTPQEQSSLGFRTLMHTPWNHFSRKNIGFLYAMRQGAESILDFDDDNELLPGFSPSMSIQNVVSGRVQMVRTAGPINVYPFFQPSSHVWPRGLPLNNVSMTNLQLASIAMPENVAVYQHVAQINPDVDAIWRLTHTGPSGLDEINFCSERKTLVLGNGTWSPFNAQATTWMQLGYVAMRLPSTVHGRVSDIWRSYIAQPLLWHMNATVAFTSPRFSVPNRNAHNLEGDFTAELPLYHQARALIDHLTEMPREQLQGKQHHQVLFSIYADLYQQGIL